VIGGIDLVSADLSFAKLVKADLRGTNLINADMQGADLTSADLDEANLAKPDLRETILADAQLSTANLQGTNLRSLHGIEKTTGFTVPQVKNAKNWELAFYDNDLIKELGLKSDHNATLPNRLAKLEKEQNGAATKR